MKAALDTLKYGYFRSFWSTMKRYTADKEYILEAFKQYVVEEYGSLEEAPPKAQNRIRYMEVFK